MNSAAIQMNVRMDKTLKQMGDEALASIGFSPSQAVRALWRKASLRGQDLEEVSAFLRDEPAGAVECDDTWVSPFEEGRQLVIEQLKKMGVKDFTSVRPSTQTDAEMLEEALWERMMERGLA